MKTSPIFVSTLSSISIKPNLGKAYSNSGDLHLGNHDADTFIDGKVVSLDANSGAGGTSEIILDSQSGRVSIKNLPTSDPGVADRLWRDPVSWYYCPDEQAWKG